MIFYSGFKFHPNFENELIIQRSYHEEEPATEERVDPVKVAPKGLKPMVQGKQAKQVALDRFLLKQRLRRL